MTKASKKNSKKGSPVFLSDHQAAHEAPDNPLDPPLLVPEDEANSFTWSYLRPLATVTCQIEFFPDLT